MNINLTKRLSDEEHDERQIKRLLELKKEYKEIKKLSLEERGKRFRKRMRGEE